MELIEMMTMLKFLMKNTVQVPLRQRENYLSRLDKMLEDEKAAVKREKGEDEDLEIFELGAVSASRTGGPTDGGSSQIASVRDKWATARAAYVEPNKRRPTS
jgi:hypothetical protein